MLQPTPKTSSISQSDINYWSGYGANQRFKSEQEARDWVFYQLQRGDKEWSFCGVSGEEKNRSTADAMPVYRDGRVFRLGNKPSVSKERLGTKEPDGNYPRVDFYSADNQDSGAVSDKSILRDYNGGAPACVYQSYVPVNEIPEPILAEESGDLPEDERGGTVGTNSGTDPSRGSPQPNCLLHRLVRCKFWMATIVSNTGRVRAMTRSPHGSSTVEGG